MKVFIREDLLGIFVLALLTLLGLVFVLTPQVVLKLQASFYKRVYKDVLSMNDEDIDNRMMLPTDRALMGRRSDFIKRATEYPEDFTGLIVLIRIIGVLLLIMLAIAACALAIGWQQIVNERIGMSCITNLSCY